MQRKSHKLEILLISLIVITIAISLYFIWPPKQTTETLGLPEYTYGSDEFDDLFSFMPRLDLEDDYVIKKVKPEDITDQEAELSIPSLNISAPIIFDVNAASTQEYLAALEGGVAHFLGSAYPGGNEGNVFIFGHSSYYYNKLGNYKEIFKNLENIEIGDEIIINDTKNNNEHKFSVTETKVVTPDYVEAFSQDGDYRLTIMTCWPTGSSQKRLVVTAMPE